MPGIPSPRAIESELIQAGAGEPFWTRMAYLCLIAICLGLMVGRTRGGTLEALAGLRFRWQRIAAATWLVQVAILVSPLAPALDPWAAGIHVASTALLAVVVAANWRLPGLPLIGLGLALNGLVLATNGGFMPVDRDAMAAAGSRPSQAMLEGGRVQKTFLRQADSPLWFAGDVIPVGMLGKVYSPGDLVAAAGVFLVIVGGMGPARTSLRRARGAPFRLPGQTR